MSRQINFLVIHCSATPNGRWTTVSDIDLWHRQRGFARGAAARARHQPMLSSIGYHWVIYTNGLHVPGRSHEEVGAHAAGHNTGSLGICLVGTDKFTDGQWVALARLVRELCAQYRIPLQFADPKDPRGLPRIAAGVRHISRGALRAGGFKHGCITALWVPRHHG